MTAIRTKSLRINSAFQFREQVFEANNQNLFVTLGKSVPWANDSLPNTSVDSVNDENMIWKSMIGGKKITGGDISLVTKRFNWTANTVYTQYDDKANNLLNDSTQFYVLTDDFNVYKCLFNNNGANSTQKPIYTTLNNTSTESDGYIWKYMYTLNTNDRRRFLTDEWMPVKTLTTDDGSPQWGVQQAAIDGSINVILVENSGSVYTNASNALVTVRGDGTGLTALAFLNSTSQTVSNIVVTSTGTNYTAASISVSGSSGTNATCRAVISPIGGHGKNPIFELGASTVMINKRIDGDEEGRLPVGSEFRQISIIQDPYIYGTTTNFANVTFTQLTTLTVSGSGPEFVVDEIVYQGTNLLNSTFQAKVYSWDTSNGKLKLTETYGTPLSKNIIGTTSGAARFVTNITNPDLKPRSGHVLYIDNIEPVSRSTDQTENITVIIKF